MKISTFKIAWSYLTGGMGKVTDYLLDILNSSLAKIDGTNKTKVQSVLNLSQKVLSTLVNLKWLVPTKWQTAYGATLSAVTSVCDALSDLEITKDELDSLKKSFSEAIDAWKSPDDETCVDGTEDCR